MKFFLSTLIFISPLFSFAQDTIDCFAEKEFLIIGSFREYEPALKVAQKARESLGIEMNLRGLKKCSGPVVGLTFSPEICLNLSPDSCCYSARGREGEDGIYISIEYSTAYMAFSKSYYIVMLASGFKDDPKLEEELIKVREKYPDAYIKGSKVWMCCMH